MNNKPTILIIEDDYSIIEALEAVLTSANYTAITASTGEDGLRKANEQHPDAIILDLILPDMRGEEVCRRLRASGNQTPILMLSSKNLELDKVLGLEIGADDYVTKPFGIQELLARIKALLRRSPRTNVKDEVRFGDVSVDFKKLKVMRAGVTFQLTAKEARILMHLLAHEGEVVSRESLLNEVWGYDALPVTRTVDNYILSLRKKIELDPANPTHLLTVHTVGYKLVL